MFTADKRKMGVLVSPRWLTALAIIVAVVVIALNIKVLVDLMVG
jgi:manganese transport protein